MTEKGNKNKKCVIQRIAKRLMGWFVLPHLNLHFKVSSYSPLLPISHSFSARDT